MQDYKKLYDALEKIAGYMLATYTFDGKLYVPAENAIHLRQLARDALDTGHRQPKEETTDGHTG